ncbi:MAG: 4-hydroxythreonine-4-phosphate dehydrogenase PdxA [Saprospiraceae bacterium]|jgi:4-hydroxythreonine-4-phosphate dehydrogenase|nr:4-hydroxythreonine-4-phosphate dehydrogenase PdxA [Saprospiraceae bacterium]MBK6478499.1 4-hydroxythreonine-4-phosphate dehydrogenase PdxA [Saprospiraceae bacterium]MBK6813995.1 4-hydroxythreonine-4-phosphate dehydrogenase PdxA [Saprospiraceae bacterium]MBK7437105.1 4-hydroxythreonine-4-phosphate dehydrogenase PdxA [Saprospiraceae bacterium]MBK8283106.1 4-hydroxythreonine-4-phosphate dehydrogenase PdxA [Saprospiraceae bacterium]
MGSNESNTVKIGITIGDINGIGPEVIIKALRNPKILDFCIPVIYGSGKIISYYKNIVKADDFVYYQTRNNEKLQPGKIYVLNAWQENVTVSIGKITETGGKYALAALDQAIQDIQSGWLDGLVTAPIHKQSMQMAGFNYAGHTDYLAEKLNCSEYMMMMAGNNIKVGLVTTHIPLQAVPSKITIPKIKSAIQILHASMQKDFGIDRPLIAVLGLNPHAGDGGVIGQEEQLFIIPAIEELKQQGMMIYGPFSADGFFGSSQFKKFDAILAMYHDQGLIPFKALEFENGVNFTAGLPVVRTSPDHGTAFDIAGKNEADPTSFRSALFGAIEIARQRKKYAEDRANPLNKHQKQSEEKVEG